MVCRYSALSGAAGMDISDARNRSIGRSAAAAAAGGSSTLANVRDYQGRMSGPTGRSSLTPRSSQEKNADTPLVTAASRYTEPSQTELLLYSMFYLLSGCMSGLRESVATIALHCVVLQSDSDILSWW